MEGEVYRITADPAPGPYSIFCVILLSSVAIFFDLAYSKKDVPICKAKGSK